MTVDEVLRESAVWHGPLPKEKALYVMLACAGPASLAEYARDRLCVQVEEKEAMVEMLSLLAPEKVAEFGPAIVAALGELGLGIRLITLGHPAAAATMRESIVGVLNEHGRLGPFGNALAEALGVRAREEFLA